MAKNLGIKKAFSESEYTPHELAELRKCKTDPIYFLENYVKVSHPKHGAVPFKLYEFQKDMVRGIHENKDTCCLASRQLGKCFSYYTTLDICEKPKLIKRIILWLLDRQKYNQIFNIKTN